MRQRVLVLVMAAAAIAGGSAVKASADPGPNGHNNFGLCTAYFAGSDNGQAHKHNAPPFVALEQAASDAHQSVADYCASQTPGGKG